MTDTAHASGTIADPVGRWLVPYLQTFRSKPSVLIIGNYGRGNLGDEAILAGILATVGPHATPVVLSRVPGATTGRHGVASVQSLSLDAVRTVWRSDVVAIGGGGIFGNGMTLLPKLLPLIAVVLQLIGKPVVFVAIGAYETAPRWIVGLLRLVARRSPLVTVRDPESARTLGGAAVLVRDPAVDLPPAPERQAVEVLRQAGVRPGVPLLGVSVKPCMDADCDARQQELALAAIDRWLRTSDGDVAIMALSERGDFGLGDATTDSTLARTLQQRSVAPQRVSIVGPALQPDMMKAVVGRCDLVVAHRLHAQIFAWSMGVELVGLSYERKSDEFLRLVGAPRLDLAAPDAADEAVLAEGCRRVLTRTA